MEQHPTSVVGYEETLTVLAEAIHDMRYDKVAEFYKCVAVELHRQARGDLAKGRPKLAAKLESAARAAKQMQKKFEDMYCLCKPHMHT